jgi:hypothetical protein
MRYFSPWSAPAHRMRRRDLGGALYRLMGADAAVAAQGADYFRLYILQRAAHFDLLFSGLLSRYSTPPCRC